MPSRPSASCNSRLTFARSASSWRIAPLSHRMMNEMSTQMIAKAATPAHGDCPGTAFVDAADGQNRYQATRPPPAPDSSPARRPPSAALISTAG